MDGIPEEIIQKQIIQSWVLVKGSLDISKRPGPDDASTPPHEGNATIIQVPSKFLDCQPGEHERLGVGHDLAGVQGLVILKSLKVVIFSFVTNVTLWKISMIHSWLVAGVDSNNLPCIMLPTSPLSPSHHTQS